MKTMTLAAWMLGFTVVVAASPAVADPTDDAAIVLDGDAGLNKRTQALERLWKAVDAGQHDRAAARETTKDLIWKGGAPSPLRQAALARLLADRSPEIEADTRKLLRLRLPTESQWPVIDDLCKAVAARASDPAWRELSGALVRSYARKVPTPPDADRPERGALLALYPGKTIEDAVFGIYLKPGGDTELAGQTADLIDKQRQAAWELLGRLDPDGGTRAALLATVPSDDPAVKPLTRAASELRVVPVTGSELAWLNRLIEAQDTGSRAWWSDTSAAARRLNDEQARGLQMRHLEPVRWSAKNRAEWLSADRAALLAELAARLEGRRVWRKTADLSNDTLMSRETLNDWKDQLVWGDVLSMLVIDEALKDPRVRSALFEQAAADRADTSTEYGGGLWASDAVPGVPSEPKWGMKADSTGFVAHGYTPRPGQRTNDRTFTAPEEMFIAEGAGGRALAHYHFHVQTPRNDDYAGPGHGDLEYAANHGRACIVFTSVKEGVLNADYYQRGAGGGAQIDLGEISASR